MKKYILHWRDGKTETVEGDNPADAMTRAGYGNGALRALDYYEEDKTAPTGDRVGINEK